MKYFEITLTRLPKDNSKRVKESYIIEQDNFNLAYIQATSNFDEKEVVDIEAMKIVKYVNILTGMEDELFYSIKANLLNAEGDEYKETYLVQGKDDVVAKQRLLQEIGEFGVTEIKETKILAVL